MRFRSRVAVLAVIFSVFCGFIGFTAGAPVPNGPCTSDATSTCTFQCAPLVGNPQNLYVASSDTTQVPYCANTNTTTCDPKAQQIQCSVIYYSDSTCSTYFSNGKSPQAACK